MSKKGKIFIYTDPNYPLDKSNIFITGIYKDLEQFFKLNGREGIELIRGYSIEDILELDHTGKRNKHE